MSNKLASNKKANKQSKQAEAETIEISGNILEYIVAILAIAVSVLVPLYLKNGYHGVGDCKYELYRGIMIAGLSITAVFLVIFWLMSNFKIKDNLSVLDGFILAFSILMIISAIAGGNFKECINGYNGWYMGILMLLSFVALYFILSRFGKYYQAILIAMLGTAFITYVIAILHRLLIDPIGVYGLGTEAEISDYYKNMFLSTLGQSSWNSAYLCTIFPVGIGLYCIAKNELLRITSGIFTLVGFMTLVSQNGDSPYFALAGFMPLLFVLCADEARKMMRFFEVVFMFFLSTKCIALLFAWHTFEGLVLEKITSFVLYNKFMWFVAIGSVILWIVFMIFEKKKVYNAKIVRGIGYGIIAIEVCIIVACIVIMRCFAKGILSEKMMTVVSQIPYLQWNEYWGNGRGKTWMFSVKMFKDMSITNKLFGVGPDGYAPYAYASYSEQLAQMWGEIKLTNAHNEWLNALINYGIIGVISYIGIFISAIVSFIKNVKKEPILICFTTTIVSYMCHNFFCYQTVCCTPFVFILIGIGAYICRKRKDNN